MRSRFSKKNFFLLAVGLFSLLFVSYRVFFSGGIDTVVKGKVYRSSQLSGDLLEKFIKERGIKTIINLRGSSRTAPWYIEESEICKKYRVKLHDIGISPNNLPEYGKLTNIVDILLESKKPILIHCHKGADRTGLVSALALAIEDDPTISELRKQISWRYGILPFYRSAGPYFFSEYEQWLNKTQRTHSKKDLLYWINKEYLDSHSNLKFWIDHVNGMVCKNKKVIVPGNSKKILVDGWAFDSRTNSAVKDFYVMIGDGASSKADFKYNMPDVARFFGLGDKYYKNFVVGWKAEFERDAIPNGCHKISFKIVKPGSNRPDIPTENVFCFEKTT